MVNTSDKIREEPIHVLVAKGYKLKLDNIRKHYGFRSIAKLLEHFADKHLSEMEDYQKELQETEKRVLELKEEMQRMEDKASKLKLNIHDQKLLKQVDAKKKEERFYWVCNLLSNMKKKGEVYDSAMRGNIPVTKSLLIDVATKYCDTHNIRHAPVFAFIEELYIHHMDNDFDDFPQDL
jgi:vacuolar-type H+-ATPase subunit I/STV1